MGQEPVTQFGITLSKRTFTALIFALCCLPTAAALFLTPHEWDDLIKIIFLVTASGFNGIAFEKASMKYGNRMFSSKEIEQLIGWKSERPLILLTSFIGVPAALLFLELCVAVVKGLFS